MYVNVQTYANGSIVNIDLATLLTSWIVYHQIHQTERVGQIAIFINNPKKRHFEQKVLTTCHFQAGLSHIHEKRQVWSTFIEVIVTREKPKSNKKNSGKEERSSPCWAPLVMGSRLHSLKKTQVVSMMMMLKVVASMMMMMMMMFSMMMMLEVVSMMVMINIANMNMIARWYARFPVRSEPTMRI